MKMISSFIYVILLNSSMNFMDFNIIVSIQKKYKNIIVVKNISKKKVIYFLSSVLIHSGKNYEIVFFYIYIIFIFILWYYIIILTHYYMWYKYW